MEGSKHPHPTSQSCVCIRMASAQTCVAAAALVPLWPLCPASCGTLHPRQRRLLLAQGLADNFPALPAPPPSWRGPMSPPRVMWPLALSWHLLLKSHPRTCLFNGLLLLLGPSSKSVGLTSSPACPWVEQERPGWRDAQPPVAPSRGEATRLRAGGVAAPSDFLLYFLCLCLSFFTVKAVRVCPCRHGCRYMSDS